MKQAKNEMTKEIKKLREMQARQEYYLHPGSPFEMTVAIDIATGEAYIDSFGKKMTVREMLKEISDPILYNALGCCKATKGTWLNNGPEMVDPKDYIEMDRDEFYIDDENAVRFYFALNSAIRKCKKAQKVDDVDEGTKEPVEGEPRYILAIIDEEAEYVNVYTFANYEEMEKEFSETYFYDEDDRKEWDDYYKEECKKESEVK